MAHARKYFAVAVGRHVGIVETWQECTAWVQDYPGARYKTFTSLAQAQAYLRDQSYIFPSKRKHEVDFTDGQMPALSQLTYLYSDGACEIRRDGVGYTLKDSANHVIHRHHSANPFATHNESEYQALISGLKECQTRNLRCVIALLDSKLVVEQTNSRWQARDVRMRQFQEEVEKLRPWFRYLHIDHVDNSTNLTMTAPQKRTRWNITYF